MLFVRQLMHAPAFPANGDVPAAVEVTLVTAVADHPPVTVPVISSMMSPLFGKLIVTFGGRFALRASKSPLRAVSVGVGGLAEYTVVYPGAPGQLFQMARILLIDIP